MKEIFDVEILIKLPDGQAGIWGEEVG